MAFQLQIQDKGTEPTTNPHLVFDLGFARELDENKISKLHVNQNVEFESSAREVLPLDGGAQEERNACFPLRLVR